MKKIPQNSTSVSPEDLSALLTPDPGAEWLSAALCEEESFDLTLGLEPQSIPDWYQAGQWMAKLPTMQGYRHDTNRNEWHRWLDGDHWEPVDGLLPVGMVLALRDHRLALDAALSCLSVNRVQSDGATLPLLQLTEKNLTTQLRNALADGLRRGLNRPFPNYRTDLKARERRRAELAFHSGVIDLRTGSVVPHNPLLHDTTAVMLGDYRPDDVEGLDQLLWERMSLVMSLDSYRRFKDMMGIAASGKAQSWRPLWPFLGPPGTGKGGAAKLLVQAFGGRGRVFTNRFLEVPHSDIDSERYWLMHDQPLLIVFDELGEESRIVLSKLLNLTGNNVLPGARLPYMKILLQDTIPSAFIAPMVVPPRLARGTGLERRVFPLSFEGEVTQDNRDEDECFPQDLLDAVVTIAVAGALRVRQRGYKYPSVDDATQAEFLAGADPLADWVHQLDESWAGYLVQEVYDYFLAETGEQNVSRHSFSRRVNDSARWRTERCKQGAYRDQMILLPKG